MRNVENKKCEKGGVWQIRRTENKECEIKECGKCGVRKM